jgi:hypothetical protein
MKQSRATQEPGDAVRYAPQRPDGTATLEDGWHLVRFEPSSGNAVIEKEGTRANVVRDEFERLNFPGNADVVAAIGALAEPIRGEAITAYASADLARVRTHLLRDCAELDPSFAGIQTTSDLRATLHERNGEIISRLQVFKKKKDDTERRYNIVTRTTTSDDERDGALMALESASNQLDTETHRHSILTACSSRLRALEALENELARTAPPQSVQ